MHGSFDITTIVFGLLAVFVIWKLRSVLGTRTGTERRPNDPLPPRAGAERSYATSDDGKVIRLPGAANDSVPAPGGAVAAADAERWKDVAEPGSKVWQGLDAIRAADSSFQPKAFVEGAEAAYEMIVAAFAKGDRSTLKGLLAKDVFDSFSGAITEREGRGQTVETTFVSLDKATIDDAQMRGPMAQISIRLHSKLISATRDKAGTVVDGNAEQVVDMVDIWTFARDVSSRDPNWKLVATETAH